MIEGEGVEQKQATPSRPRKRRRTWLWIGMTIGLALGLLLLALATIPISSEVLRRRLVGALSDQLQSQVEIRELRMRLLPTFRVEGVDVTVRHRGRSDVPPLIKADRLTVASGLGSVVRRHVEVATLVGLEIHIPPDPEDTTDPDTPDTARDGLVAHARTKPVVIDRLTATDARLVILPKRQDKPSRVWHIHQLDMQSLAFDRPMAFEATLTNAIPPGEIETQGTVGPWQAEVPGATPLQGHFAFRRADLSVFRGIAGTLASEGQFAGSLARLDVNGTVEVPEFSVSVSGHPVPLHADYHATVDARNGDTLLNRIDATFLETALTASGGVISTPGTKGRTVTLDVVMEEARLEDVLRLAVKAPQSPMTGSMTLKTRLVIPPGDRDVVDKLQLDGRFAIARARFTNVDVRKKLNELSRRSRDTTLVAGPASVASNFAGRFVLRDGTLRLPTLTFEMPGSKVRLAGAYTLRPELLAFKGHLVMDAKISETQKGWKRWALKPIDPLFTRDDGTGASIPIRVEGRRSHPSFGLDAKAVLRPRRD